MSRLGDPRPSTQEIARRTRLATRAMHLTGEARREVERELYQRCWPERVCQHRPDVLDPWNFERGG